VRLSEETVQKSIEQEVMLCKDVRGIRKDEQLVSDLGNSQLMLSLH